MKSNLIIFLSFTLPLIFSSCIAANTSDQIPEFEAGKETVINFSGYLGHIRVFLPEDYSKSKFWPVIFYYHDLQAEPDTSLLKQVTDGRGFIIVGMNYASKDYLQTLSTDKINEELWQFNRVIDVLSPHINLDQQRLFMSGYGQGGYSTTLLGELLLPQLKGLIILASGRKHKDSTPADLDNLKQKPIFVAVGDKDVVHSKPAKKAARNYLDWDADITFESWFNTNHDQGKQFYMRKPIARLNIQNWLAKHIN